MSDHICSACGAQCTNAGSAPRSVTMVTYEPKPQYVAPAWIDTLNGIGPERDVDFDLDFPLGA